MGIEIERKFLVKSTGLLVMADWPETFYQSYLMISPTAVLRIRRIPPGTAELTFKSATDAEYTRAEFNFPISYSEALELELLGTGTTIHKRRYRLPLGELTWEVDVYRGENSGLVIAEVELPRNDYPLEIPNWVGLEVSHDPRYTNQSLALNPYSTWKETP